MPTDERSPRHVAPITCRTRAANAIRDGFRRRIDRLAPGRSRPTVTARVVTSCVMLALVGGAWWLLRPSGHRAVETVLPRASAAAISPGTSAARSATGATGATVSGTSTSTPAIGGSAALVVHVVGAVNAPGVVRVAAGSRVLDAVAAAGGLAPLADTRRVNLAAKLVDGQRVVVPAVGESVPTVPGDPAGGDPGGAGFVDPAQSVNLNDATVAQLDVLPGVGPATAAAIVAYRTQHGPFRTVDALSDVHGIGPAKLEQLRPLVTV